MKGMILVCAKANGYEIRAANWGIDQQRFVQLPAEWCHHAEIAFAPCYNKAEVGEEDQSRRCRNAAVIGDRCGVEGDPRNL